MESTGLMDSLPEIRRARAYRIYDIHGKRYLDMYLDGGRAILGHKPSSVFRSVKNNLDRGLLAPYPAVHRKRLVKALLKLIPGYPFVYLFPDFSSALSELEQTLRLTRVFDPAVEDCPPGAVVLWRPFLPVPEGAAFVLPVLPLPGGFAPCPVMGKEGSPWIKERGGFLSPLLLAALERSVWDLASFPAAYGERYWASFPAGGFVRKGPYLRAECGLKDYEELFRAMLPCGLLLSPAYPGPSIIPAEYSEGEVKALARY